MSLQWLARARCTHACLAVAAVLRVGWLGALARSPDLLSRLLWSRHARQSACLPRAGRCLRHAPAWPTRASSVCHERACMLSVAWQCVVPISTGAADLELHCAIRSV